MLKHWSTYLDFLEKKSFEIGYLLIIFSMLSVVLEVISTNVFNHSFLWVNEISEYILLYIPFLGAAYLLRQHGHITVDILEHFISVQRVHLLDVAVLVLCTLMSLCLLVFSAIHSVDTYQRDLTSMTLLEIPQIYVVIIIPYGSALLSCECIRQLYQRLHNLTLIP